jgi:D-glycero-D-manno-heptose 1,7-bisphosphate phosphatase
MGTKPYLVLTGKGAKTQAAGGLPEDTQVFANLSAVVAELLKT